MKAESEVLPRVTPELDPGFRPMVLASRQFQEAARATGRSVTLDLAVERSPESVTRCQISLFPGDHPSSAGNFRLAERTLKFLLWARGGWRIWVAGSSFIGEQLRAYYRDTPTGGFDAALMGEKIYARPFEVRAVELGDLPAESERTQRLGGHWQGCRVGFDLGASDIKVAAVRDGTVLYSDEFRWDPRPQQDPQWHFEQIQAALHAAASHLPRVDTIGGSSAGVIVGNEVRVASLFRGVPDALFETRVRLLFREIQKSWGDVPFEVVNDGEVTALAGSMSLESPAVLGIAMGSSLAAGFVSREGNITPWLNELAFAPVDVRNDAPFDEWSGDRGCGVQFFSQQAVARLIPASGLPISSEWALPDRLLAVQTAMKEGDERAARIYRTLGVCLGYAAAQYREFYDFDHLLLLGRVTTGVGGDLLLEQARRVLALEFPEIGARLHMPDEKQKRHGQAMAAASLPASL